MFGRRNGMIVLDWPQCLMSLTLSFILTSGLLLQFLLHVADPCDSHRQWPDCPNAWSLVVASGHWGPFHGSSPTHICMYIHTYIYTYIPTLICVMYIHT